MKTYVTLLAFVKDNYTFKLRNYILRASQSSLCHLLLLNLLNTVFVSPIKYKHYFLLN